MLKDTTLIKIESGMGGRGSMALRANRAFGGDGGDGGNVYLKGSSNVYDLSKFDYGKKFKADSGGNGLPQNKKGTDGKDLIVELPLVTEVYVDDELVFKVEVNGEPIKVLDGGIGGLGNRSQKKFKFEDIDKTAKENKELEIRLVLKLQSDVIFIGYPNAGKSSMLNELTNARVKTAAYEFTTLEPQLGFMGSLKLMDLPGLIDGASEGKGLGTRFLKHTENSKLVAHFVGLENDNPYEVYTNLREEMKKIGLELYNQQEVVLLSKSDDVDEKKVSEAVKKFEENGLEVIVCSIIDDKSIQRVKDIFEKLVK